jgi:hypothetical protein
MFIQGVLSFEAGHSITKSLRNPPLRDRHICSLGGDARDRQNRHCDSGWIVQRTCKVFSSSFSLPHADQLKEPRRCDKGGTGPNPTRFGLWLARVSRTCYGRPSYGKDTGMGRINLLVVVVACAAGAVGCTQCDTCDDFPMSCAAGNCPPGVIAQAGGYTVTPTMDVSPGVPGGPAGPAVYSAPLMGAPGAPALAAPGGPASAPFPSPPAPVPAPGPEPAPAPSAAPSPFSSSNVSPPAPMSMGNPLNPRS